MRKGKLLTRIAFEITFCLFIVADSAAAQRSFTGMELSEALLALKADGIAIVFTSELVRPGMRIEREPESRDPRTQLDEILEAFNLRAQEGAGGIVVVVPARASSSVKCCSVTGRVRDRETLAPIAGAIVRVDDAVVTFLTDESGRFNAANISAGRHSFHVTTRGFVDEAVHGVGVVPGIERHLELLLSPAPFLNERIEVFGTPGTSSLEPLATTWSSGHDELERVPQLGDPLRGLALAPGTAAGDLSARLSVRGGRPNETSVVLDGQEIYDPWHLKDYESALTIIPSLGLASATLLSGGLSSAHGDRMGGVVDLRTRGSSDPTARLSVSTLDALAQSTGAFASERGSWLVSARRGLVDVASEVSANERPTFWDVFGRLDLRSTSGSSLRAHVLVAGDDVDYSVVFEGDSERLLTSYASDYFWLTHAMSLGLVEQLETNASWSRTSRDRNGSENQAENVFEVHDKRDLDILEASQSITWQPGHGQTIRLGWEFRDFDADFDYMNEIEPDLVIEAPFAPRRQLTTNYAEELHGRQAAGWISDRITIGDVAAELGLRYDDHSLPEESFWSPRTALAWQVAPQLALIANWGVYRQSQRPYELQVEDGETALALAERSEQWSVGLERQFASGRPLLDSLHIEYFHRRIDNPRSRYESLLEPINRFHEVEPDRVFIDPDESRAEGIELVARGKLDAALGWQLAYTWSESSDMIDGTEVPRSLDQPNAATLTADWSFRSDWSLDIVWSYHTGWPTTPVTSHLETDPEGDEGFVLEFGALNSERLPDYHRMDLRLNRSWQLAAGEIRAFVELRNAWNRQNVAGYDVSLDEESGEVTLTPEYWPGIVPVIGFVWEFCGRGCGVR
ncbi:MAG: TonB-dependent receptor [Thermoanaerobaculia bacterium]|jgi:hypothetical protein